MLHLLSYVIFRQKAIESFKNFLHYNLVTTNYFLFKNATIDVNNEWKEWNFMFGKWMRKLRNLFIDEVEELEQQEKTSSESYNSNVKARVSYQYPKERTFRFPVIPDQPQRTNNQESHTYQKEEKYQKQEKVYDIDVEYHEHKVYKKTEEPFKVSEIPSPIYGFRKRSESNEKIEEIPAFQRKEQNMFLKKGIDNTSDLEKTEIQVPELEKIEVEKEIASTKEQDFSSNRKEQEKEIQHEEKEKVSSSNEPEKTYTYPFNVIMSPSDKKRLREKKEKQNKQSAQTADNRFHKNTVIIEKPKKNYLPYHLLDDTEPKSDSNVQWIREQQRLLEQTLKYFKVRAKVVKATQGPSVTRFEVQPEMGVKVSKIKNLSDDLKLNMAAKDIRIEAPIPGKNTVGIEIPNKNPRMVGLQEIFDTTEFKESTSPLTIALGLSIEGQPKITNIQKMPHGLIAGATGSGKSVCINTMLVSILYKASHEDVRILLIDPKMVELAPYNGIPHLVAPVITDVKAATQSLKWAVNEMEDRYERFVQEGVRNIEGYNKKILQQGRKEEKMPFIVIVIDELADLMMTSPQDVENSISRIAQKARACGIHLILATQRPSVDVITGLIKANIPTRIAFSVSSQVDSRTIIDVSGAEKLLGKGDMLFVENGAGKSTRLQGPFVSDEEIERITSHARSIAEPNYLFEQEQLLEQVHLDEEEDEIFEEAVEFVIQQGSASTSLLQRHFKIGYNRAARLIDSMENKGIISGQNGSKPRDVLISQKQEEL